jgi:hypothetical protein
MTHVPHDLAEDFPGAAEKIHRLKQENAHFAKLVAEYDEVNREVHRAETNLAPVEEMAEIALRKRRAALKDEIARLLARA